MQASIQNSNCYRFCALLFLCLLPAGTSVLFSGCAKSTTGGRLSDLSGLYPTIAISHIPAVAVPAEKLNVSHKPSLNLAKVEDTRSSSTLITYKGRDFKPQGDITRLIHYVLLRALRLRGFAVTEDAPITLNTELSHWQAEVVDQNIESEAVIFVKLIGPGQEIVYSAVYEGFSLDQSPAHLQRDVQHSLGQAMHQALSNVVRDSRLVTMMASY